MGKYDDETHHIVEIPVMVDNDKQQEQQQSLTMSVAIQHHPLAEISQSPGHLLLLKLWQREDDLLARRIAIKETRLDSLRREISFLCSAFLLFQGLFFALLFTASVENDNCFNCNCNNKRWWVPSFLSVLTSMVIVWLVHAKLRRYWKVWRQLQRERTDNRALGRCVQELRMKGSTFDLSREPFHHSTTKKMKSSSVEINWGLVSWCKQYLAAICLLCIAALLFPAPKLILCVF